jgi:ABC-type dipeptide/oligopeptide/nickel transport system ATPase component
MVVASSSLLCIENLHVAFETFTQRVSAVAGVSLDVARGKTVALVGESGSGKSVTALAILGLLPEPNVATVSGRIWFEGQDLLQQERADLRRIRGKRISMIFQEPGSALNPVFTVADQIAEVLHQHQRLSGKSARRRTLRLLRTAGFKSPGRIAASYPHQLSGGMRQRVMIAIALAGEPALLIADEPTTALDVRVQSQILDLLRRLQTDLNLSILLITHDFGVVAELADEVYIMRAGQIVEHADVFTLFERPANHYTRSLLDCVPRLLPQGQVRRSQKPTSP